MSLINCKICSVQEIQVYNNLKSVILPAYWGQIQILPEHAESFILLTKGKIILEKEEKNKLSFDIKSGFCYFNNNNLVIIL
ncbi:hypothetical protein J7K86_01070 [bacterium]|nr:hypothetical protein [bacterium]